MSKKEKANHSIPGFILLVFIAVYGSRCAAAGDALVSREKAPSVQTPSDTPHAEAVETTVDQSADSKNHGDAAEVSVAPGGPPVELVQDNMETTAYSGVVRIVSVNVTGPGGGPVDGSGYVNHVYEVAVLDSLVGDAGDSFAFAVMADADSRPMSVGRNIFVSVCKAADANMYYTPDNGYVFSAAPALLSKIKALNVSSTPAPAPTACGN